VCEFYIIKVLVYFLSSQKRGVCGKHSLLKAFVEFLGIIESKNFLFKWLLIWMINPYQKPFFLCKKGGGKCKSFFMKRCP